jgi:hypothetical protein
MPEGEGAVARPMGILKAKRPGVGRVDNRADLSKRRRTMVKISKKRISLIGFGQIGSSLHGRPRPQAG